MEHIKKCVLCGAEFSTASGMKKYCGTQCSKEGQRNARKRKSASKKRESDLARLNEEARAMGMHYGQYVAWKGV